MPTIRCREKIRNKILMKKLWERGKKELMEKKEKKEDEREEERFKLQNKILEWFEKHPPM
jgi:hypothetical protein